MSERDSRHVQVVPQERAKSRPPRGPSLHRARTRTRAHPEVEVLRPARARVHGLILYKRLHLPRTPLQFALAVTTFNLLKEALAPEITEVQNGVYDEYIDEHVETKIENILITAGVLTAAFYLAKAAGAGAAAQRFGQFAMSFVTSFSFRFGF